MNIEEYERMYDLEGSYWWFQGRRKIVESLIDNFVSEVPRRGRVLDVGCGTGLMLARLRHFEPVGFDFSPVSMQFCRMRGLKNLLRGDVVKLPLADNSVDLILALDLIEHIERDDLMIKEFNRVLRPGGYLVATVPAHESLWSDHDVALHHFRRYSYKGFRSLLKKGGFSFRKYSYGISFTYLPIVCFRKLQKLWQKSTGAYKSEGRAKAHLIPLPWFLNFLLIQLLHIEAWLLKKVNLPQGISLITVCQKKS